MSQATLEKKTAVDAGSDLASLVIAHHRACHDGEPESCPFDMCQVAHECINLDAMMYGTDA